MTISGKLLGSVLFIFLVAFASLAYLVDGYARSALMAEAGRQLEAVRQSRAQALTTHFRNTHDAFEAAAGGLTADVLLREMPGALRRLPRELGSDPPDRRARLTAFYRAEVDARMKQAGVPWPSAEQYVSRLTPQAIAVQSEYTVLRAAAGEGDVPASVDPHRTTYGALNALYQPIVLNFAQSLNWHDLILIAPDGTVVYSMRKDIELGMNVLRPPFSATHLAAAFEHAMQSDMPDHPFFTDFAPYAPANGAPMSFMSAPVLGVRRDAMLGVAVLALSLNEIDRILAEHAGFGRTEQIYVVGPDLRVRRSSDLDAESTAVDRVVDADAVRRALGGQTGIIQPIAHRNEGVLASFGPLRLPGVTWAIVAEIDLGEVLVPARGLGLRIFMLFLALSAAVSVVLVIVLRRVVLTPIQTLTHAAQRIQRGHFDQPVALAPADEFGQLGQVVNTMMQSVGTSLQAAHARLAESQIGLRHVSARLNDAREQERTRLARDVHDHLGQSLTAFKMDVAEVRRRLTRSDYPGADARLREMSTLIDTSLDEMRRLAFELHPPALEEVGAIEAIRGYLLDFSRRTSVTCRFDAELAAMASPLPKDRATAVFRILQEALTNVVRHAHARYVDVHLTISEADVSLTVHDDGCGVPPLAERPRGLGLVGMRDRALLFGGDVSIEAGASAGTTVRARLPLTDHP